MKGRKRIGGLIAVLALVAGTAQTYAPLHCAAMASTDAPPAASEGVGAPHDHGEAHAPGSEEPVPGDASHCPLGDTVRSMHCGALAFLPAPIVGALRGPTAEATLMLAVPAGDDLLLRSTLFHPPRS